MPARILLATMVALLALVPAAEAAVLFREDFNGPAGALPNQAVWRSLDCRGMVAGVDCADTRARLDGGGALNLEVTPLRGAFIGTFDYGTGWPPRGVRASFSAPFTVTARLKTTTTPGIWNVIWLMNTDRARSQGIWELDMAEPRSALPNTAAAYHHWWGATHTVSGKTLWVGGPGEYHTYQMVAGTKRTKYYVDGRLLFEKEAVAGRFGILVHSLPGAAGTWATNHGPVMPASWARSKLDYIEVSR